MRSAAHATVEAALVERGLSEEEEVETVLEAPALEYLGNLGRTVAERVYRGGGWR